MAPRNVDSPIMKAINNENIHKLEYKQMNMLNNNGKIERKRNKGIYEHNQIVMAY